MKQHPKIDIFIRSIFKPHNAWKYECSTTWSSTCRNAKAKFIAMHNYLDPKHVKASFAK